MTGWFVTALCIAALVGMAVCWPPDDPGDDA